MEGGNPTLGQLLKRVCDANDHLNSPDDNHQILEIDSLQPLAPVTTVGANPFVLRFTDLTYSVKISRPLSFLRSYHRRTDPVTSGEQRAEFPSKTLLDSISGKAREGEILAVLGASGSGKSTLIDALAGKIRKDSLRGSITLNGDSLDSKLMKVISAYVMQDDLLFPMLTVEETLMFSAEFRLPRTLPNKKKKARVQVLIDQLDLRRAAKTIIGDEGHRGVSGGERRRVSIGIDIIHDPIILFLDEPTSGLDSTSAVMVVKVLQRIAHSGSIVVMSVHQPSSRIIGLLDRMLFLSRGQTVYSGCPDGLPSFFAEFGHPIPEKENRTEFALDVIRELEMSPEGAMALVEFNQTWQSTKAVSLRIDSCYKSPKSPMSLKEAISASISRGKLVSGDGSACPMASVPIFANPFWIETAILLKRSMTSSRRQPELFGIRLGVVLVTGFFLATIFWRLDNSPMGVQERLGFFTIAMSTMFYSCGDSLPVFIQERYIFMRETAYNAYRRSSYVLSHAIVGFPPLVFLSIAFAATTFFAVGLAGGLQGFIYFVLIVLGGFWAGSGFITFLSGILTNVMLGFAVVVATLAYFIMFSGFFITRDQIPHYWIWFHYMSSVKYPYEAVMQNEFSDPNKCFVRGVQMFDNTPLEELPESLKLNVLAAMSKSLGMSLTNTTCIVTGLDILKRQGITQLSKWNCLWVTMAWGFFFRVLFYFSLLLGSKGKRR